MHNQQLKWNLTHKPISSDWGFHRSQKFWSFSYTCTSQPKNQFFGNLMYFCKPLPFPRCAARTENPLCTLQWDQNPIRLCGHPALPHPTGPSHCDRSPSRINTVQGNHCCTLHVGATHARSYGQCSNRPLLIWINSRAQASNTRLPLNPSDFKTEGKHPSAVSNLHRNVSSGRWCMLTIHYFPQYYRGSRKSRQKETIYFAANFQ